MDYLTLIATNTRILICIKILWSVDCELWTMDYHFFYYLYSMSFRYNTGTLQLIESIFKHNKYVIRYEKGSFQSGYCILQDKKVVVVNKFYDTESRINALIEIFQQLELGSTDLDEKQLKIYQDLVQHKLEI
jgi:hypothetical protein